MGFDQDKWLSVDKGTFHPEKSITMDRYCSELHLTEIYKERPAIEELTQTVALGAPTFFSQSWTDQPFKNKQEHRGTE